MNVCIQLVGLLAIACQQLSVQLKFRKQIVAVQMLGSVMWFVHFSLLHSFTGAFSNLVGAMRAYVFYRWRSSKYEKALFWAIMGLILVVSFVTWQGPVSLLAIGGIALSTIGLWQKNEQRLRVFMLAGTPLWFAYGMLVGSYAGMGNEALFALSNIVALVRYRHMPMVEKRDETIEIADIS